MTDLEKMIVLVSTIVLVVLFVGLSILAGDYKRQPSAAVQQAQTQRQKDWTERAAARQRQQEEQEWQAKQQREAKADALCRRLVGSLAYIDDKNACRYWTTSNGNTITVPRGTTIIIE